MKSAKALACLLLAGLVTVVIVFILAGSFSNYYTSTDNDNSEDNVQVEDSQSSSTTEVPVLPPKNCQQIRQTGIPTSGVYVIQPDNTLPAFEVYCDMTTDGGGWTVIQRRGTRNIPKSERENFYRNWSEYEVGFGRKDDDYWLGLEKIHSLTSNDCTQELLINFKDWQNVSTFAKYGTFQVTGRDDFYRLFVFGYSGDAGENMLHHHRIKFTTFDRDNDEHDENCAVKHHRAWWYRACYWSNLNGEYSDDGKNGSMPNRKGIEWGGRHGYSYMQVEMKIRDNC